MIGIHLDHDHCSHRIGADIDGCDFHADFVLATPLDQSREAVQHWLGDAVPTVERDEFCGDASCGERAHHAIVRRWRSLAKTGSARPWLCSTGSLLACRHQRATTAECETNACRAHLIARPPKARVERSTVSVASISALRETPEHDLVGGRREIALQHVEQVEHPRRGLRRCPGEPRRSAAPRLRFSDEAVLEAQHIDWPPRARPPKPSSPAEPPEKRSVPRWARRERATREPNQLQARHSRASALRPARCRRLRGQFRRRHVRATGRALALSSARTLAREPRPKRPEFDEGCCP